MEVTEPWHFASLRKLENETSGVIEHDVYEGVWRAICNKITFRLRHMACYGMLELCFDAHRKPRLLSSTLSQTSKKIWKRKLHLLAFFRDARRHGEKHNTRGVC